MRPMNSKTGGCSSIRSILVGSTLAWAAIFFAAVPSAASPAFFDPSFGFQSAMLEGLPSLTIDGSDAFLMAGEAGAGNFAVDITGSTDICLFTASSPVCQSDTTGVTGPYSALVTFQVSAVNNPLIPASQPFSLFLSGLMGDDYDESEVSIELDPTVPSGLDVSGIAGFNLIPFERVIDETFAPVMTYNYIGWTVQVGDSVSFRYDVNSSLKGGKTPQLTMNVVNSVVPEPGTALLVGIGLAGLATGRGRWIPGAR
jgi:hypothetical protein